MAWNAYVYDKHITQKTRKRRFGGGRKARLASREDTLLFLLVYCKVYPLQEVMASMFAMSQGRVNEWIYTLSSNSRKASNPSNDANIAGGFS